MVPGKHSGYAVNNTFRVGPGPLETAADIDPDLTATDLTAPGSDDVDAYGIIVCVSDHPDADQNEPYVSDGLPGEVAAVNRPIVAPTVSALGVSAVDGLNTYKVGFGYAAQRSYDDTWKSAFRDDAVIGPGLSFGDPPAFDLDHDGHFDHVVILNRATQRGVRRYNDIDEFGEEFNNGPEKTSYGQPVIFDTDNGDAYAYLHKSFPGTVDGGGLLDVWQEALADQTSALGVLTFTTQGDLPISWSVKASLAPESYGRSVALTDDMLRAWNKSWQDYYDCKGPKPSLRLAPGTNSPAPDDATDCGAQEAAPAGGGPQAPVSTTTNTTTTIIQQVAGANAARSATGSAARKASTASIRSARVIATRSGKRLVVFVKSASKTARIQIRMYGANGRKLGRVTRTVATNRSVKVSGIRISGKAKTVKVTLVR